MKVLHVVHRKKNGGAEKQAELVKEKLKHRGIECLEFTTFHNSQSKFKVIKNKNLELYRLIKSEKVNHVIIWTPVCFPFAILARFRFWNIKYTYGFRASYRIANDIWLFRLLQYIYFYTSNNLLSNVAKEQLYFPYNILFRWKGNNVSYVKNIIPIPDKVSEAKPINKKLYFAGRLVKEKGVNNLLNIVENTSIKVVVSGRGTLQKEVEVCADKCDNLIYTGHVSSVIEKLLELNGFFLLSSLGEEGIPNVVLEALSVGMPVLITDVKEHTFLFPDEIVYYVKPDLSNIQEVIEEAFQFENENRETLIAKRLNYIKDFRKQSKQHLDTFIDENFK